eukprot:GHVN01033466.1.p2 GENE.GHVN01033466.1~~GHVN01033466.1.p2  ORF type:complete len:101 (-),score=31.16 GHVN01033466.1:81-383(-)
MRILNGSLVMKSGNTTKLHGLEAEICKALRDALKTNETIEVIDLSRNATEFEGIKALSEAIKINKKLTTFVLKGNEIGAEGGQSNEGIRVIELNNNSGIA